MFAISKEKRFARQVAKTLLKAHAEVSAEQPELSGDALYRAVILRAQQVDPAQVDHLLRRAEDSVDEWTAGGRPQFGFRELVHYLIMSQYEAAGHEGAISSFREVVYAMIPANL